MPSTPQYTFKRLLMLPVHFVMLFTGAKSFRGNSLIGSVALNRLGLHTARVWLARAITCLRWLVLSPLMPKPLRRDYHARGFVVIPDFISGTELNAIRQAIAGHSGPVRQLTQGDTATQRILLDAQATEGHPALQALTANRKLFRYLSYCGAKIMPPLLYIQRIRNGRQSTQKPDPQKNLHADTFHPTMKAWLFLEDVPDEKGPFTYVEGSHKYTKGRRKWEHEKAISASSGTDKYSEKGSFRVTEDDLKAMGLPAPKGVTVTAGTLVIANTNGFHGRGQAEAGASRLEIWAYSRHNPFNPLPGITLPGLAATRHFIMQRYWRFLDNRAKRRGGKASWHLVATREMLENLPESEA